MTQAASKATAARVARLCSHQPWLQQPRHTGQRLGMNRQACYQGTWRSQRQKSCMQFRLHKLESRALNTL